MVFQFAETVGTLHVKMEILTPWYEFPYRLTFPLIITRWMRSLLTAQSVGDFIKEAA